MIPDVTQNGIEKIISLKGKTAVVTGAAAGLGKATARRLSEAGASLLIADIDAAAAQTAASEIEEGTGNKVYATHLDVSSGPSIAAAVDRAVELFGGIDIWVNNAGIPSVASILDVADDEWDRVMSINLRGTMLGSREAAKVMVVQGRGGVIVNIASLAGMCGIVTQSTYGSSKAGVIGLTQHMSADLAKHGIRVLGIAPGIMLTENKLFIADMDPAIATGTGIPGMTGSPMGRHGVPDDIARVVLFCASDLSLFMTGVTLLVDGGVRS